MWNIRILKYFIFCICLLLGIAVFAQFDELKVKFIPAFDSQSTLTLTHGEGAYSIILKGKGISDEALIPDSCLCRLNKFLDTYEFEEKGMLVTSTIYETNEVGDTIFEQVITEIGLDGMAIDGEIIQSGKYQKFSFWSPRLKSLDDQFLRILFDLLDENLGKNSTKKYLKKLKSY